MRLAAFAAKNDVQYISCRQGRRAMVMARQNDPSNHFIKEQYYGNS